MRVLGAADRAAVPWKNGGGVTFEVAAQRRRDIADPAFDFDWRVSIARVGTSGPFSRFPDVDRVLTVVDGAMALAIDGGAETTLTPTSAPHAFPGDVACEARVIAPVTDLNVMTRRGAWRAKVDRLRLEPQATLSHDPGAGRVIMLVVVLAGEVRVTSSTGVATLGRLDALQHQEAVRLSSSAAAQAAAIRLEPVPGARPDQA